MQNTPISVFNEYRSAQEFKASMGRRGLTEQTRMNERFFIGDQWHGARCGNERPLVRHNVIKRIGDFKMSQILNESFSVRFEAEGFGTPDPKDEAGVHRRLHALSGHYSATADRVKLDLLQGRVLRDAYISGTGVLYTYWDSAIRTGLYADRQKTIPLNGDINCEVLSIENVCFADPYTPDLQNQPFVILFGRHELQEVLSEAQKFGADQTTLRQITEDAQDGKVAVITKLFKEYQAGGGYTIKSVKVTEHAVIRPVFDTCLTLYPLAIFQWEKSAGLIYGESEVTYLIPNQIAINRMITANVWSAMTTGMPIMLVNGDTVPEQITNEPGQIVKVYGTNDDVSGALQYVVPPNPGTAFSAGLQDLINNTMTQNGANEVALGDSRPNNASALLAMRNAAILPLDMMRKRFFGFVEEVAKIWADFWIACYGKRAIKVLQKEGITYMPFDPAEYRNLILTTKVETETPAITGESNLFETLITLFEKGVISRRELLERVPDAMLPERLALINKEEESTDDRV